MILLGIDTQPHVINVWLLLSPARKQFLNKGSALRIYRILFISSRKSAAALATTQGMTFQRQTQLLGVRKASSSWAAQDMSTCKNPLCFFILVLN